MKITVGKTNTVGRMKLKLLGIILTLVGLTCTSKDMKIRIIKLSTKKMMKWCAIIYDH
jgi:hypothetical protein